MRSVYCLCLFYRQCVIFYFNEFSELFITYTGAVVKKTTAKYFCTKCQTIGNIVNTMIAIIQS